MHVNATGRQRRGAAELKGGMQEDSNEGIKGEEWRLGITIKMMRKQIEYSLQFDTHIHAWGRLDG